jgi:hypothetical protein
MTPLRSLHLLPSPPDEALVAVIRGYFDNSGDAEDRQHKWLTLGGYLANEAAWERFEGRWKKNLDDFGLPYLHMREFAHFRPPFDRFKTDEAARREFLGNCIGIIGEMKPKAICHAIRLEDVRRFNAELDRNLDPLAICLYISYIDIRETYGANNRIELIIDRIVDRPHLCIDRASQYAKTDVFYTERYGDVSSTIDTRPIKDPDSAKNILPLQAVDFLVWEMRKSNTNIDGWFAQIKHGLPNGDWDWISDYANWNIAKHGVPSKERHSLLMLDSTVPSDGASLVYDTLKLMEKYHPNGWGDS